ncbi:MAG: hypothetical protein CVV10_02900, partial [Gammaproteobacteria bacterium HGW-Gammaproteobacteria-14]
MTDITGKRLSCSSFSGFRAGRSLVRALSLWLAALIIWQPLLVHASDVRLASGSKAKMDRAANGTTIVNIEAPNSKGLSHNTYSRFDVSQQGLILNNSNKVVKTGIAGYIDANPNLGNGSARVILNEVTSRNPSDLRGFIEVGGKRANVIVANPNGISCDGCGFINTNRATLSTGRPVIDDGMPGALHVTGGTVNIGAGGLNALAADQFDVIAEAVHLSGDLYGNNINLITGKQRVEYASLGISNIDAGTDSSAGFSISSSALGGIYGDRIRLIATESGVGVRLNAPVSAQSGDIEISADGNVRYRRLSAARDINIESAGEVIADGAATAIRNIDIDAAAINLKRDSVEAKKVVLNAASVQLDAEAAIDAADLKVSASMLANQGILNARDMHLDVSDDIENSGLIKGEVVSAQADTLLNNDQAVIEAGDLAITVTELSNQGALVADTMSLAVSGEINNAGMIQGNKVTLGAGRLDNLDDGVTVDQEELPASESLVNTGSIQGHDITVSVASIRNSGGELLAVNDLTLNVDDYQHEGEVQAGNKLSLTSKNNISIGEGHSWEIAGSADFTAAGQMNNKGRLVAVGDLSIAANAVNNDGHLASLEELTLSTRSVVNGLASFLLSGMDMTINARTLHNYGDIYSLGALTISGADNAPAERIENVSGLIASGGDMTLNAKRVINKRSELPGLTYFDAAPIVSFKAFDGVSASEHKRCFLTYPKNESCHGFIAKRETLTGQGVRFSGVAPRPGQLYSGSDIKINGESVLNEYSDIHAVGGIVIHAEEFRNLDYRVDIDQTLRIDISRHTKIKTGFDHRSDFILTSIERSEDPGRCGDGRTRCHHFEALILRRDFPDSVKYIAFENVLSFEEINSGYNKNYRVVMNDGSVEYFHSFNEENKPLFVNQTVKSDPLLSSRVVAGGKLTIKASNKITNGKEKEGANLSLGRSLPENGEINIDLEGVTRLDPFVSNGFTLPGKHGLFTLSSNPLQPLIVSDPLFATRSGFMGSAYMLDRLGWSPDANSRRLGDAFYEMKMLQDLLIAQPGVAAMDQLAREKHFEVLMDNGIAAAESLQLSIGVSLSADQVNALQADMIWLEEKVVAGQKVLVPVVYLSSSSLVSGGVLAGENVDLRAGEINNHGVVRADTTLNVEATAANVTNTGQLQAGELLKVTAKKDIVNLSGELSGHDITLDAGGDVIHRTAAEVIGNDGFVTTAVGSQAAIDATGKLTVTSGGNIHITGASMSGESVSLKSDGSIIVDTVAVHLAYDISQSGHQSNGSQVSHLASSITSTLDLLMEADNNITLMGAGVTAGGNASLLAGNNIRIEAVADEFSHYHQDKSSGSFGRSSTTSTEVTGRELVGTSIVSGGVLTLNAEKGSIAILASTGHGEQGVQVDAGGDVIVESGINASSYHRIEEDKNAARVKTTDSGYYKESLAVAGLSSGGELSINAEGSLFLIGAELQADKHLRLGGGYVERDKSGAMLLDEQGQPIVLSGGLSNIVMGVVALEDKSWDVTTRELRGPVKAIAELQNFALDAMTLGVSGALGVDGNIKTESKKGHYSHEYREEVSVVSGRDITMDAKENLHIVGAQMGADNDLLISAGGDVIWDVAFSATTSGDIKESDGGGGTSSSYQRSVIETSVNGVTAAAGGNLVIKSGGDIQITAGKVNAAEGVLLDAGGEVSLLAAYSQRQEFIEDKSMGEFGTSSTLSRQEKESSHAVVSEIKASNITITSKGNQTYEAASLESAGDIALNTDGKVIFASVKDIESQSAHSEGSSLSWQKVEGGVSYDETIKQSHLQAAGQIAINAAKGVKIDIVNIDKGTVSEMIDAMVDADPKLAWLKDMEERGDVDWKKVKEVHEQWDYDSQGMGPGLALATTIVATAMTGGAGAGVVNAVAGAGAATATTTGVVAASMAGAVVSGSAAAVTVSTVNNGGKLDRALSDLGSRDSLEGLGISAVTAGLVTGVIDPVFNEMQFGKVDAVQHDSVYQITKGFDLNDWKGMTGFTLHNAAQGVASAGVSAAIQGGSFNDHLKTSMENQGNNVLSALAFNQIGNLADHLAVDGALEGNAGQFGLFVEGGMGRVGLHGVTGGLVAEATGGDFATGAAAAGLNQWLSPQLDQIAGQDGAGRTAASQLAGLTGAMLVGGDVNDGAWIAKQADAYNRQLHSQELKLIADNYKQYAAERGISEEQALKELVYQAHVL